MVAFIPGGDRGLRPSERLNMMKRARLFGVADSTLFLSYQSRITKTMAAHTVRIVIVVTQNVSQNLVQMKLKMILLLGLLPMKDLDLFLLQIPLVTHVVPRVVIMYITGR